MKKTLMIAAAAATMAIGFNVADTTSAQAGGYYGSYAKKCKVTVWDPHYYRYVVKWVPCGY